MYLIYWFISPIRDHYVDFSGRASRETFWMYTLMYFLLALLISSVEAILGTVFISVITSFAFMLPSLAITTRRLHDTGMSGWWQLAGFVPLAGPFVLIVLLARPPKNQDNPYDKPEVVETFSESQMQMA